jgi:hypothetical protein
MKMKIRRGLAACCAAALTLSVAAMPALAEGDPPSIKGHGSAAVALLPDGTPIIRDRA